MPLVEIGTAPDIESPAEAKEVALYIGALMRLSGRVQRGIGSVRQDVNISIKGGARIEIKGFQEIEHVDKLIENEVERQHKLLEAKEKLNASRAKIYDSNEVTSVLAHTHVKLINESIADGGVVLGFKLEGFRNMLSHEINPDRRIATEISDYAKMAGVGGLIHSDEVAKYKFSEDELNAIKRMLSVQEKDAFIIIAGRPENAARAIALAISRAKQLMVGIPNETRVAIPSTFATKFVRPLPGGARMYPETDAKPIRVTKAMIEHAKANAPNADKQLAYLNSLLKNPTTVKQMLFSPRINLFRDVVSKTGADPEFVANVLLQKFVELRRENLDVNSISEARIIELFQEYKQARITKLAVEELLRHLAQRDEAVASIIKREALTRITGQELESIVKLAISSNKGASTEELRTLIMSKYRKNVDGSELNTLLSTKR